MLNQAKTQAIKQVANLQETKEFTNQLLPGILSETNLQFRANTQDKIKTVTPNSNIPVLKELLETKYVGIISQSTTDIGRTNLLELDIPMEGPPIASNLIQYHSNTGNLWIKKSNSWKR